MVIGPFKETRGDVINQLYGVGGFNIVNAIRSLQTFIASRKHDEYIVRREQIKRTGVFP
jgi:hypothetical protein